MTEADGAWEEAVGAGGRVGGWLEVEAGRVDGFWVDGFWSDGF